VRNPDAETNVVPPPTPIVGQRSGGVTHFKRHEHSLQRRVLDRHWIIEYHHYARFHLLGRRRAQPRGKVSET
jgi:hypothetical protein